MGFDFKVGLRWMYSVIAYNVKKLSSLPQHTYKKTKFIILYTKTLNLMPPEVGFLALGLGKMVM